MLCPLGDSLNGSHVSHLPDLRSMRCTPANPLFCAHTLPSTPICIGLVILICVLALFRSGGMFQTWNVSVFLSNFAMLAWYIMPSHKFCSLSKRTESDPVGEPFFGSGTGYSMCFPVLVSSFPQRLLAEIGIPGDTLRIDDYVMRLYRRPRQVVLGYDNPRGFALGARQRLEWEIRC